MSTWTDTRLGACYRVRDERAGLLAKSLPLLSVSQTRGAVPRSDLADDSGRADDLSGYKLCRPGDIVLNRMSAYNGALGVAREHGLVSPDYLVMKPDDSCNADFLCRWLKTPRGVFEMARLLRGIGSTDAKQVRTPRVNNADLRTIVVALPPLAEQCQITNFLDRETARIDLLIEKQQQLIETLRERRSATVTSAVSFGTGDISNAVSTGGQWFQAIKGGWSLVSLGRLLSSVSDGPHFSPDYLDQGITFLSARNIKVDRWSLDDAKFISQADYETFSKRARPEPGDVLYTKGGTTGVARVVDLTFPFQVWVHVAILKLRRHLAEPRYLAFALNSSPCYEQSQLLTQGATNNDLGLTRMVRIVLPLPSLLEQAQIADYLDEQTSKIDVLIEKAQRFIELSKERRSALITAAVTGQIDVRNTSTEGAA